MHFLLVPSTITVTIQIPSLERLLDYLGSKDGQAAKIAELTAQLGLSSTALKAEVEKQP